MIRMFHMTDEPFAPSVEAPTDEQFYTHFEALTSRELFDWLCKNTKSIELGVERQGYTIDGREDLIAAIEQQMYQELTGRE